LTRVENFVVGQSATVYGRNLRLVTAVTVDGVAITFRLQSDSAIAFVVPVTRSCETDGRVIQIDVAPGAGVRLAARIKVAVSTTLQPGQSVLLAADTLSCLQLPAADNSYVLTVSEPGHSAGSNRHQFHGRLRSSTC
jgi:hypothetical protein